MKRDSNVMGIDIAKRVFHVIGMDTRGTIILCKRLYLLSAPLMILLVCCHINSFRQASRGGEAMARRRKEERRAGIASRGM